MDDDRHGPEPVRPNRVCLSGWCQHLSSWRPCLCCSEAPLKAHRIDGQCVRPWRNSIVGAERLIGGDVSEGSNRAGGGLPIGVDVALLRPRLLPLSADQEAEALALLSELLLAAAHRSAAGRSISTPSTQGSPLRRELAAGELAREGLAASAFSVALAAAF